MSRFRNKPVIVEAIRCRDAHRAMGSDWNALPDWFRNAYEGKNESGVKTIIGANHPPAIDIVTLEGTMRADVDDWIICGARGEIHLCKSDVFEATYEPVSESTSDCGEYEPGDAHFDEEYR